MDFIHSIIKWASLALLVVTVLILGGYPNWVAGPATACFCALGAAHLALSLLRGSVILNMDRTVGVLAVAVVFWLTALVGYDCVLGVEGGRVPSVSARQIPLAFAFFSALMLGSQFKTLADKRAILWTLSCLGAVVAVTAFVEKCGWDIKRFGPAAPANMLRPSGILLNANRAAVMMSLCLSATLALLASALFVQPLEESAGVKRRVEQFALSMVALVTAGGLVSTLSRLSILCFGVGLCVVTWVWTLVTRKRVSRRDFDDMPLVDRIQRGVFLGLPVVVLAAWVAWTLGFGGQGLTERLREVENGDGRFSILRSSIPLMLKNPWVGVGLGGFDSAFTQYQPANLGGRWNELHWDWLQTAIEAGWPAVLLLVALMAAWIRSWWNVVLDAPGRWGVSEGWVLRLIPWAGCAAVLMCSVADFPLREPGIAFSFLFLAAIISRREEQTSEVTDGGIVSTSRFKSRLLAASLLVLMLSGAFVAGRNGWACVNSPWLGQRGFPPTPGLDPSAWEKAIAIDPGDPQFHYYLGRSANLVPDATPAVYQNGINHAKIAMKLKPTDYLIPWSASFLAENLGNSEESDAFMRRAIELHPASLLLHRDRGLLFLRQWVKPAIMGSLRREEGIQKAVEEFRLMLESKPDEIEKVKQWMLAAGCLPEEVSQLWQGSGARECVLRAKFFAEQDMWEGVGLALRPVDSSQLQAGSMESIWYHALSGILDIQRRDDPTAIAHWESALSAGSVVGSQSTIRIYQEQIAASAYMIRALEGLEAERLEAISVGLVSRLAEFQDIAFFLARGLSQAGRNVAAERVLKESAGTSATLNQLRAQVSLNLNDEAGASEHALKALQYGGQNSGFNKWYAEFMLEVDLRKRKRKGQVQ